MEEFLSLDSEFSALDELTRFSVKDPFLLDHKHLTQTKTFWELFHLQETDRVRLSNFTRTLSHYSALHAFLNYLGEQEGLSNLGILPYESRLLEVGAGYGAYLRYLSIQRPDLEVLGIDISDIAVSFGKKIGGINLILMDIKSMGFNDESFDIVLSNEVIDFNNSIKGTWFVPDERKILESISEVYRILKPNGRLFLSAQYFDLSILERKGFYCRPIQNVSPNHEQKLILAEKK